MRFCSVNLDAVEYVLPEEAVSTDEIERRLASVYERLNLPAGRIELMTGIRNRHFWPAGTLPSDAAVLAGEKVLAASRIAREKIGCLLFCSVCRDCLEPASASVVHHRLGLSDSCTVFDLSNACLGFLNGMQVVANMIELGQIEAGMLVAGEDGRPLFESTLALLLRDESMTRSTIKPHFASLTIGSGSVAAILCRNDLAGNSGHRFLGGVCRSNTTCHRLCSGGSDGQNGITMSTDSEQLLQSGVELAAVTWTDFLHELQWDPAKIALHCAHQVGKAHRNLLFDRLGLDRNRDFPIFEETGNIGSVSCPMTLAMAAKSRPLFRGDCVAMLGIGSGINCCMLGVEW
jgi:3-oxoacyl-[acyl-carrier-protein] synthase-3